MGERIYRSGRIELFDTVEGDPSQGGYFRLELKRFKGGSHYLRFGTLAEANAAMGVYLKQRYQYAGEQYSPI